MGWWWLCALPGSRYRGSSGRASDWRPGKVEGLGRLEDIIWEGWEGSMWEGMLAITPPAQRWQAVGGGQAGQGGGGRQEGQ